MKIKGNKIPTPSPELVVISRTDEEGNIHDFPIKAVAVLSYDEFEELCPEPKPPLVSKPNEEAIPDLTDKVFRDKLENWGRKRSAWMVIKSLSATDGLEWELVDFKKPDTWEKYEDDLTNTFSHVEVNAIISAVMSANAMDENKMIEAKKRFLASLRQAKVGA